MKNEFALLFIIFGSILKKSKLWTKLSFAKSDKDPPLCSYIVLKTKYNVDIAGGQDHLAGKIFRINHMGLVEDFEASWAVNAVL